MTTGSKGAKRRQWRNAAAGMAIAAFVAGCGPKNDGGNGGGRGENGSTVVHLAYFPNVTHSVALVGVGSGAFDRAMSGAKVETQVFNAGPAEMEALLGNNVDIGYIGPGPAINGYLKSKGKVLRIIAGASSGGASLVVREGSGITDIKGLTGKKVGVPQTAGTQDISLRHAMQTVGLSATDKGGTVAVLPNPPADILTLFIKGELDAAWVPEPWATRLVAEGNGTLLLDERTLWPDKKFATTVVIARTAFLQAHPGLIRKFLDAHIDTVSQIAAKPDEARKTIAAQLQKLTGKAVPDAQLTESLTRTDFTYDPIRTSVLTFADYAQALGYSRQGKDALNDLIDLKPLNDALAQRKLPAVP